MLYIQLFLYFKLYYHNHRNFLLFDSIFTFLLFIYILVSSINRKIKVILLSIIFIFFSFQIDFVLALLKVVSPRDLFNRHFNVIQKGEFPGYPSILVVNYCKNNVEYSSFKLIPIPCAVIAGAVIKPLLHFHVEHFLIKSHNNSFSDIKDGIKKYIEKGVSIFSYVTRQTNSDFPYIHVIRSGMFRIAQELDIPVTPVYIDYIEHQYGYIPFQNFRIVVGNTFKIQDIQESINLTRNFYRENMKNFILTKPYLKKIFLP